MTVQDEDLLERALAGLLEPAEEATLAERLKGDPALARRLVELSREEALFVEEVVGRRALQAEIRPASHRGLWVLASAAAAAAALALVLLWPGKPELTDYTALVVAVEGEATARVGDVLGTGASLRTAAGGRVGLRYPDGTTIELGARTDATFERRGPSRGVRMTSGLLAARVAKLPPGETFYFVTPHAEARVLGTELRLSADGASTRLEVAEGRVLLTSSLNGKAVEVPRGHFARVEGQDLVTGPLQGTGLQAEYFDNVDFTVLRVSRIDPAVDFDWGEESPFPSMEPDTFSVRWTGRVEPRHTGTYTFYVVSDDGTRLWIDGQLIVDDWTVRGTRERTGTIDLVAGRRYDLKLEYLERVFRANVKLLWSSASQPREVIPRSQLHP